MIQMNLSMKQKQAHRYREQTCGCQGGGGVGEGRIGGLGLARAKYYRMDYIRWINNKVLLVGELRSHMPRDMAKRKKRGGVTSLKKKKSQDP